MELRNKTILILSPQAWGKMFLSKHHYAVELAKRGNKVYFLNPPEQTKVFFFDRFKFQQVNNSLTVIDHQLFFPYWLKFKWPFAFRMLMKRHIKYLLTQVEPVDVVWSFDIGHLYPFSHFKKGIKIFHPVDEPRTDEAITAAKGAQIIFSVTPEILEKYHSYNVPRILIPHGVSHEFIADELPSGYVPNNPLQVGISGNLLRPDIDRKTLQQIIQDHQNIIFNFWGSYQLGESNIGGAADRATTDFINFLRAAGNVRLHGVVPSGKLADAIKNMDAFLICYDVQKDHSKGTNYHKVMEYLGTGRVVISNNITTYKDTGLIEMCRSRENNDEMPALFEQVIQSLEQYNSKTRQQARKSFARNNTYAKQVDRIEKELNA